MAAGAGERGAEGNAPHFCGRVLRGCQCAVPADADGHPGGTAAADPKSFSLANVALAVLLRRKAGVRQQSVPIRFRERYGGEPSVRIGKFGEKAVELVRQIRELG